jgi:hypothetical protein
MSSIITLWDTHNVMLAKMRLLEPIGNLASCRQRLLIVASQYQEHLRQQLVSKSSTKKTCGGVLNSGYGALDEVALAQLEVELEMKEIAEVAKVLVREAHKMEWVAEKH